MLVRGLRLAIERGLEPVVRLFAYDGSDDFLERYVGSYDDRIIWELAGCDDEKVRELFTRLLERRLFKQVAELSLDDEVGDAIVKDRLSGFG